MALADTIQNDMKAALLSGDRFKGEVLRNLKAAILNEEVAQNKRDTGLSDEEIEKIIAREVKKRAESIRLYESNDRPELADNERSESLVLEQYLPQQLTESEIITIVETTINEMGAQGAQAMGMVMKAVKDKVGNTADGATLSRIVKDRLNV